MSDQPTQPTASGCPHTMKVGAPDGSIRCGDCGKVLKVPKASHVGAPAIFALELACKHLRSAFGGGVYLVGSAGERAGWRDVDVVQILDDDEFGRLFPDAKADRALFEFDPRWLLMTISISGWLKQQTGLPIDFKFQPRTWANKRHEGMRQALGLMIAAEKASST